jgi:hypothetical protein
MRCDHINVGRWFEQKWQQRLRDSGSSFFTVASQMRKQGIPLEIALALLVGRAGAR